MQPHRAVELPARWSTSHQACRLSGLAVDGQEPIDALTRRVPQEGHRPPHGPVTDPDGASSLSDSSFARKINACLSGACKHTAGAFLALAHWKYTRYGSLAEGITAMEEQLDERRVPKGCKHWETGIKHAIRETAGYPADTQPYTQMVEDMFAVYEADGADAVELPGV